MIIIDESCSLVASNFSHPPAQSFFIFWVQEFDKTYGPAWHCIVGSSFGSFVTHSVGGFLYFSMDQKVYILLFKTTVQRAD
jgi:hypothetical protein